MKILIADDEALARTRLRSLVQEIGPELTVVGEATNGVEMLHQHDRMQADIVLLDIRMPRMDGLEAAGHLSRLQDPPAVIFTTAYEQHALQAFETHAVDYLLKPIRKVRLEQALDKARALTRVQLSVLNQLKAGAHKDTVRTHLCVQFRGAMQLISMTDVLYFRADQKYINVRHTRGEVLIEDSLKSLEQEFAGQFLRVHRNALVARRFLEGMGRGADGHWQVQLRGIDDRLQISRRHVAQLRRLLKKGGSELYC
jgi:two-component system response regulator AlgR